jgi:hypothetical protein
MGFTIHDFILFTLDEVQQPLNNAKLSLDM